MSKFVICFIISNQIFHCICFVIPKRVTIWLDPFPQCAWSTQPLSVKYCSGWQYCVCFHWPQIWTSDLLFQRWMHHRWRWWYYPTPSEGWGCGETPWRPNCRATPQGLDHRSRIEREEPKIDLRRDSEAGQSRRRWLRSCRGCRQALQAEFSLRLILRRYEDKRRLWPWQWKRESSQRIGRERSSSSEETSGTWKFRWKWEMWRLQIVVRGITDFGNDWVRGHGIASLGREAPALASKSAFSLPGRPAWPRTHWKLKVVLLGREEARDQTSQRDSGRRKEGTDERIERADWESVRKRTDWNLQVIKWLVHQSRPCLRAKVSAVKMEAIGPVEKDRELDVLHLEHVTYTPAPPAPKREGTDPSVHTWISKWWREDSLLEADWSRAGLLPVQSWIKGETMKWVAFHGGKGGAHDQSLTWGWEWMCGRRTGWSPGGFLL